MMETIDHKPDRADERQRIEHKFNGLVRRNPRGTQDA